ncbi:MAG: type VI secretion system-associated FHA domain protein TagH [Rhizobiaceae bacterium]
MSLLLTIEHGPRSQTVRHARLDEGELVIGRSAEADWQIDDPDMFVSRAHCTVSARGGGYVITDTSSSGLFIDDATSPLGTGNSAPLRSGMRLRLGDYVLGVEMPSATDPRPAGTLDARQSGASRVAAGFGHDDFFAAQAEEAEPPPRPSGLPDPFEKARPSAFASYEPSDADRHKSPAFDDPFSMEPVATPAAPQTFGTDRSTDGPDDPFGFYASEAVREPPARPLDPIPPPPASATTDAPRQAPPAVRAPWEMPVEAEAPADARPSAPEPARPAPQIVARPLAAPEQVRAVPPPRLQPAPMLPVPEPASRQGEGDDAYAAFMRGLGLDGSASRRDPAAEMEKFGREYRLMLEGLMQLLRKRAEEKGNARVAQTVVGASDVNPLKFMPTADDALSIMMRGQSPGFLGGEAAIADSIRDLASHHVRAWRGVQGALRRMIDRFDPAALEEELKSSSSIGTLLAGGKSAKLWELYQKRHREIAQSAETRFLGELGTDFRDAYEEE